MFAYPFTQKLKELVVAAGDFVENAIGNKIEGSDKEAPELTGVPEEKVWYKLTLEAGIAADGSPYHIYLKKGKTRQLCIFFSGGGVAWDDYSAVRPVTGGRVAAGKPNFYWNNLRPFTQIMNINVGITETGRDWNPFDSWSFIVVTYATGDFHVGNRDYICQRGDGQEEIVHFKGYTNFREAMKKAVEYFPNPGRLLIAGDSAGGFAVPALAGEILDDWYPDCRDVTLLSDSSLLLFDDWHNTARNVWGAKESFWKPIVSDNIFLDWFRNLTASHGDRFRYLFACSVRDQTLSAYYNAVHHNDYSSNDEVQTLFQEQLCDLVREMRKTAPKTGFFINSFKFTIPGLGSGGTVHTAVRKPFYHVKNDDRATMARWLYDAVHGNVYNVGLGYLGFTE